VSADRDRHPQNHSPSNSDSSSSSYRGSPPSFEAPTAPAPAPAPGPGPTRLDHPTFGQPSFAHSYYGHLRTPPTSFAAHRSAAGGHDAPLGTAVGDPARYHHQMAAAAVAAYDRNAPVVLPPPRPGIEVVRGAGLPSARRIVTPAYAPYYASPFSAPAPDPGHGVYGGDGQHAGGGGVSE
jgi:hypothetical protein